MDDREQNRVSEQSVASRPVDSIPDTEENSQLFAMVMNLQAQNHQLSERAEELKKERDFLVEQVQELEYSIVKANELAVSSDMANLFKTQFLANMSHDIRTPMNGVIGMARLLSESSLSEDQREFTQSIIDSGETLLALINDILDISKIEAGELDLDPAAFDLHRLLKKVAVPLTLQAQKKKIELRLKIEQNVPTFFYSDENRLAQIINNLAGNAIKFTEVGHVTIKVCCLQVTIKDAVVRVEVADTGIGIPREAQTVIFEKFKQADSSTTRKFGGTGLGLAISRQLVEMMGGTLALVSDEGVGSTFYFELRLPLASRSEAKDMADVAEVAALAADRQVSARVLLVEDSLTNQKVATRVIERIGCVVDIANNGQEAVDLVRAQEYTLVFMDCQMPVMDGYAATRLIREEEGDTHHVPIVAMTANVLPAEKAKCLEAGMDEFITKPIDFDEVKRTILRFSVSHECAKVPASEVEPEEHEAVDLEGLVAIDPSRLKGICSNDVAFIREIVESFFVDVPQELDLLQEGLRKRDIEKVRAASHKIKGAASNIGAERLNRLGMSIQMQVESGHYSYDLGDLEQVQAEIALLEKEVAKIDWLAD